ncbi:MAG: hypothetical protein L3K14_03145 [Thermoplasmata archaeon]|nr:hypothetical protein [Thermoplasmata archaeon]
MSGSPMTSIPVHADVLHRLQVRKTGGKTWDEFLLELVEEYDPPEWVAEMERRRKHGRDVSSEHVLRLHTTLQRKGR